MNTDQVYAVIERLAATPKRTEHLAILQEHADDETLRQVLLAANDPFANYGFGAAPLMPKEPGHSPFFPDTWRLLEDLDGRELAGNDAFFAVQRHLAVLSPQSATLFGRILTKDLRCGVGTTTINKVFPGLIPVFPYMRCSLLKEAKIDKFQWEKGVFSQEKADGMFCNLDVEAGGRVRMTSRQGSEFPILQFYGIAQEAAAILKPGTQTHGELLVEVNGKVAERQVSNGILNRILEGGTFFEGVEEPIFVAWDQIPLDQVKSKGKYHVPYVDRFLRLEDQVDKAGGRGIIDVIPYRISRSFEQVQEHFREVLAQGKEGIVFKCPTAIWEDTTSRKQVKLKLDFTVDLKIVGLEPGKGKNEATFGSVIVESADGALVTSVSGFTDKMRQFVFDNYGLLEGTVMAVRANSIMQPGPSSEKFALFLPRFVELRKDKLTADTLAQVQAQYEAAVRAA